MLGDLIREAEIVLDEHEPTSTSPPLPSHPRRSTPPNHWSPAHRASAWASISARRLIAHRAGRWTWGSSAQSLYHPCSPRSHRGEEHPRSLALKQCVAAGGPPPSPLASSADRAKVSCMTHLATDVEQIKEHEGHVTARSFASSETERRFQFT